MPLFRLLEGEKIRGKEVVMFKPLLLHIPLSPKTADDFRPALKQ
jgi:hypothetical protein